MKDCPHQQFSAQVCNAGVDVNVNNDSISAANPPADVVVTIVVKQDTLIPTQLQAVWQNNVRIFYNTRYA